MKVGEFIKELQKLNADAELIIPYNCGCCSDGVRTEPFGVVQIERLPGSLTVLLDTDALGRIVLSEIGRQEDGLVLMPIKPENRSRYPEDWAEISKRIRFDRAQGCCECKGECGIGMDPI